MNLLTLLGIALALAMDAFAVSIAVGVSLKQVNIRQFFRLSFHFGLFQALMPILGWFMGTGIHNYIKSFDHWVAFGLLAFVGTNMIREAVSEEKEDDLRTVDPTKGLSLIVLSVATSIDALAVGLSISLLGISIAFPAFVIGIVAFTITVVGLSLGQKAASFSKLSLFSEIVGGIVLWMIGLKILYDQNVFSILT